MTEAAAPKPYDTCMYIALVLGVLTFIGGIICAAIGGFGLTVVGAVMLILAGVGVVPAFILRNKCLMNMFVVLALLLSITGGIMCGFAGFMGGIGSVMCSVIKGHEDDFYVCPTTSDNEMLCIATVSWGSYMYGPLNDYDSSGSSTNYCSHSSVDTKVKCMAAQDFSDDTLGCYWGSGSCTSYYSQSVLCSNDTHAEACLDTYPANSCTWDNTSNSSCGAVDSQPSRPLAPASNDYDHSGSGSSSVRFSKKYCSDPSVDTKKKCMAAQDLLGADATLGCYWGSGDCTSYYSAYALCSDDTHAEACLDTYPANLCTWDNTSYSPCGAVDPQPPQPLAPASSRRLSTAALDSTEVDSTALDSTALDSTGTGRRLLKNSLDIISRRATTYTKADCAQYANPVYGKDDKKCCEGMIAAGKKKCISADTDQACKDSANSWTAGGCNSCSGTGYFSETGPVVVVMEGAPAVGVASSDTQPPPGGVFMKNGVWLDKDSQPVQQI